MEKPSVIDYQPQAPRRGIPWKEIRIVAVVALALAIAWGGWRLASWIEARVQEAHLKRHFQQHFDQVAALAGDGRLWSAFGADDAAKKHLVDLLDEASEHQVSRMNAGGTVLFMYKGDDPQRPWLAFGCFSREGPDVYVFFRDNRRDWDYVKPFMLGGCPTAYGGSGGIPVTKLLDVRGVPDAPVRTTLTIDAGTNVIDWHITEPTAKVPWYVHSATPAWLTVRPRTGWDDGYIWWFNQKSADLGEGPKADRYLSLDHQPLAVEFLNDKELAVICTDNFLRIRLDGETVLTHPIPTLDPQYGEFVFSPDGLECHIGGYYKPIFDLNCQDGTVREPANSPPRFRHSVDAGAKLASYQAPQGREAASSGHYSAQLPGDGLVIADTATGKSLLRLNDWLAFNATTSMSWCADSTHLVIGSPGYAYVWSSKKKSLITRFPGIVSGRWSDAALSPNGKQMVVTDSANNRLYYWSDVDASILPTTRP